MARRCVALFARVTAFTSINILVTLLALLTRRVLARLIAAAVLISGLLEFLDHWQQSRPSFRFRW